MNCASRVTNVLDKRTGRGVGSPCGRWGDRFSESHGARGTSWEGGVPEWNVPDQKDVRCHRLQSMMCKEKSLDAGGVGGEGEVGGRCSCTIILVYSRLFTHCRFAVAAKVEI